MRRRLAPWAIALLVLPACGTASAGRDDPGPLVVVLFDVSQSTRDVRGGYLDAFERVLTWAGEHEGRVVADVIDENPLAHSTYPVDVAFDDCDAFTENPLVCQAEVAAAREDAIATARGIVEGHAVHAGTDVLGGFRLAERVFASYPDADGRSLVVLSDMLAHSSALSLRRGFTEADVGPTLVELRDDGLVPDLAGVQTYVVGAGVVSGTELPGSAITAVQRFWERLVAEAGGELRPERYGAALVRFP